MQKETTEVLTATLFAVAAAVSWSENEKPQFYWIDWKWIKRRLEGNWGKSVM